MEQNNGLKDYYADESRSFAIGFASWLSKHKYRASSSDIGYWVEEEHKTYGIYSSEELYDIYIKQLIV